MVNSFTRTRQPPAEKSSNFQINGHRRKETKISTWSLGGHFKDYCDILLYMMEKRGKRGKK